MSSVTTQLPFVEEAYLIAFPDVRAAVEAGTYETGHAHYLAYGQNENRLEREEYATAHTETTNVFTERFYLFAFPDVADAVNAGTFPDGRVHYNRHGQYELRLSMERYLNAVQKSDAEASKTFNESAYLLAFPDVATGVENELHADGADHYNSFGRWEYRLSQEIYGCAYEAVTNEFTETAYRLAYPDVDAAITAGSFANAFDHFCRHGRAENRLGGDAYKKAIAVLGLNPTATQIPENLWEQEFGITSDWPWHWTGWTWENGLRSWNQQPDSVNLVTDGVYKFAGKEHGYWKNDPQAYFTRSFTPSDDGVFYLRTELNTESGWLNSRGWVKVTYNGRTIELTSNAAGINFCGTRLTALTPRANYRYVIYIQGNMATLRVEGTDVVRMVNLLSIPQSSSSYGLSVGVNSGIEYKIRALTRMNVRSFAFRLGELP